jgi:hypothetical protein
MGEKVDAGRPRPWRFRRTLGPLIAYHALVIVGGLLMIDGVYRGSTVERDVGAAVLGVGVATALAVLVWTARLARAPGPSRPGAGPSSPPERTCPRCGRPEREGRTVCVQCGAALVWSVRSN